MPQNMSAKKEQKLGKKEQKVSNRAKADRALGVKPKSAARRVTSKDGTILSPDVSQGSSAKKTNTRRVNQSIVARGGKPMKTYTKKVK